METRNNQQYDTRTVLLLPIAYLTNKYERIMAEAPFSAQCTIIISVTHQYPTHIDIFMCIARFSFFPISLL